jgi:hypothetical protein
LYRRFSVLENVLYDGDIRSFAPHFWELFAEGGGQVQFDVPVRWRGSSGFLPPLPIR